MKKLEIYVEENDQVTDLLLMKVAFSGRFMKKVAKQYADKHICRFHAPCCSHGYFDYDTREEAKNDICSLLNDGHYVILGEDWGEFLLVYGYENEQLYCVFPRWEDGVWVPCLKEYTLFELLQKVGYVKETEEKRLQVRTMQKNAYFENRGIFKFFS